MKQSNEFINSLQEIEIVKPTDLIIQQIKGQISKGILKPGEQLAPEREISKKLGVGRGYVREAIKKLEFYGILKTIPHRGTVVASLGVKALEGLISNILELDRDDYKSLIETRKILESNAARLTAERASDDQIKIIEQAHQEYVNSSEEERPSIEIDLMFHLRIAEFCKNSILRSIITFISPDIITLSQKVISDREGYLKLSKIVIGEHEKILEGIRKRDPDMAAKAMSAHLQRILNLINDKELSEGNFDIGKWISSK